MHRGVIANPAIININGNGFTMERSLSPQEIRYYALYWDKIVIPGNNLVYVALPEEDILIESGVIERPRVNFQGSFGGAELGHSFAMAQSLVAEKLIEEDKKTDWVLHQVGNQLSIPKEYTEQKKSLQFELVNILPVPDGNTPIADILEFKNRRKTELEALHETIEQAYIEALKCPDPELGSKIAIRNLQKCINDLETVSNEKWKKTSKFSFATEFNLDGGKIINGIASGAAFDFFTNAFTLPIGTIVGGVASIIKLKTNHSASFKPASNQSKLAFLSYANKEQIIK